MRFRGGSLIGEAFGGKNTSRGSGVSPKKKMRRNSALGQSLKKLNASH